MSADAHLLKTLERRNQELEALIEIGKALTSTIDLEGVLAVIMDHVAADPDRNHDLDRDGARRLSRDGNPHGDLHPTRTVAAGEGVAGWVAEHGEPLVIADVKEDPRFSDLFDKASSFNTRSVLCVPVRSKDHVLGVIELVNGPKDKAFSEADVQILLTIADYAAIAIENARNFLRINELVITDDLTELYNGRYLHTLLDEEILRSQRFGDKLSLIFIDLDFFKNVNDTCGHLVGSRTLAEVGRLITDTIRKVCKAARYGGDEFVIVLPNTGKGGAMTLANKLCKRFRSYDFYDDKGISFKLTASFGVATFPDDANSKEDLIRLADQAMYRVKEMSRDAVMSA
ncbi:MAG: sensor domain-containing diguanylate cyclase [Desulfuromonadales bacterium]